MVERRRALADTSFFVGLEAERIAEHALAEFELGVAAVTLGELRLGVLSATSRDQPEVASRRLATYQLARQFDPIPVDEDVSDAWALLVAQLRRSDVKPRSTTPGSPQRRSRTTCRSSPRTPTTPRCRD
jgi:predicted nucleic acid-binding protein